MIKVIIGLLLVALELNMNFNGARVNVLLPDFLGYIVILFGIKELSATDSAFEKANVPCIAGIVFSGVMFIGDIFAREFMLSVEYVTSIVAQAVVLWVIYTIISAIKDVEEERGVDLNSSNLKSEWQIILIIDIVLIIMSFLVMLNNLILTLLLFVIAVLYLAVNVAILVSLNTARKIYDQVLQDAEEE